MMSDENEEHPVGRYLSNVTKDAVRTASAYHSVVARAARNAGIRVEYRDHPQPRRPSDMIYRPDPAMGSIYTHEPDRDHSEFHRECDRLWASI